MNDDSAAVLEALEAAIRLHPGLRVGQLIVNALPDRYKNDPFYVSDLEFAYALANYGHKEFAK